MAAAKVQVCVFDMRRGQVEGLELEKILFFAPGDCPLPLQISLIGLSEGLITFTRIFSPGTPCELMDAERHTHVFYECEPDIWMVMVVEKRKENKENPREMALRAVLKEAYDLFRLLYGPIRALLDAHPNGEMARRCLCSFFPDYLSDFLTGKKSSFNMIGDSLTEKRFPQLYLPQPKLLLEALSIQGLFKSWFGGRTVHHVLIIFQNFVMTTTLPPLDTTILFQYVTLRMLPLSSTRSSNRLRDHLPVPFQSNSPSYDSSNKRAHSSMHSLSRNLFKDIPGGETEDLPHTGPNGSLADGLGWISHVPRPFTRRAWCQGEDGSLDTEAWGAGGEEVEIFPEVWLHSSEEWMHLCVYQCKSLTIVMLIPAVSGPEIIASLRGQLLEKGLQKLQKLEHNLIKHWPGVDALHVPGLRYLYRDWDHKVSRFSPASKVATLSKDSLASLNRIRAEVDLETGRMERATSMWDREFELCLRNKQNAWVVVRSRGGYELYTVLEKAGGTLLLVCEAVDKLSKWLVTIVSGANDSEPSAMKVLSTRSSLPYL